MTPDKVAAVFSYGKIETPQYPPPTNKREAMIQRMRPLVLFAHANNNEESEAMLALLVDEMLVKKLLGITTEFEDVFFFGE